MFMVAGENSTEELNQCNQEKTAFTIFKEQREEKKRKYQQRETGIFHSPSFWNQRWDGRPLQLLTQTLSRQALRKE